MHRWQLHISDLNRDSEFLKVHLARKMQEDQPIFIHWQPWDQLTKISACDALRDQVPDRYLLSKL